MSKDVTGLAVALTATARTKAHQLSRDLQTANRRLDTAGDTLTAARRAYAKAADEYRALYDQALGLWTADELTAAGATPAPTPTPGPRPPPAPRPRPGPAPMTPTPAGLREVLVLPGGSAGRSTGPAGDLARRPRRSQLREAGLPHRQDPHRQQQLGPHRDQHVAVEHPNQILDGPLVQDRPVGHPQHTGTIQIHLAAPRSPQHRVRQLDDPTRRSAQLVQAVDDRVRLDVAEGEPPTALSRRTALVVHRHPPPSRGPVRHGTQPAPARIRARTRHLWRKWSLTWGCVCP